METDLEDRSVDPPDMWTIYIDQYLAKASSGEGIVILTPDGSVIEKSVMLDFKATNNESEYEALIIDLKSLLKLKAGKARIHTDSKLVACQMTRDFAAKCENMEAYRNLVLSLAKKFDLIIIGQHSRITNAHVDALATLASVIPSNHCRSIQVERLSQPSISEQALCIYMADENLDGN
jgi:ribonuclease HI